MKPEKALEILDGLLHGRYELLDQDEKEAILLAIRAIDLCLKYQVSEEFIHAYFE